ncbi:MAG: hypothetical protein LBT64_01505, partial [Puniceicoccales bacterium]|nr:hypothetical protein [Puniceicoccales bacterium]
GKVSSATENATIDQKKCPEWQLRQAEWHIAILCRRGIFRWRFAAAVMRWPLRIVKRHRSK